MKYRMKSRHDKYLVLFAVVAFCGLWSAPHAVAKPPAKAADSGDLEKEFDSQPSATNAPAKVPPAANKPFVAPTARIAELKAVILKNERNVDARIELAEIDEKQKNYSAMIDTLRPAAEHLPRKGMILLARAYAGEKDFLQEVRALELLVAQNPKDYYVQNLAGEAYLHLGKTADAITKFNESRTINGQFRPAYDNLVAQYQKTGEQYEALTLLTDMVKIFGEQPDLLDMLCKLYSDDGYLEKALEVCPRAIEKSPTVAENQLFYAQSLKDHEQVEEAGKVLEKAAQRFPHSEITQWTAGSLALDGKNFSASYRYFQQCTKADAKSARCFLGLGKSAFELQKHPEAVEAFGKACLLSRANIGEVRKAAASLRQHHDTKWSPRYDAAINRCAAVTDSPN